MRLRGPHLIGQANLNTSVSSQSGSIPVANAVLVTFSPYTFLFASLTTIPLVRFLYWGPWISFGAPVADADDPNFALVNDDSFPKDYSVEWRHINP